MLYDRKSIEIQAIFDRESMELRRNVVSRSDYSHAFRTTTLSSGTHV